MVVILYYHNSWLLETKRLEEIIYRSVVQRNDLLFLIGMVSKPKGEMAKSGTLERGTKKEGRRWGDGETRYCWR